MPLGLFETSWFFELNKRQMWCFECFVSETQLLLSRPESKHRSECLPQGNGQLYWAGEYQESTTIISSQKSSWELWYRQSVQRAAFLLFLDQYGLSMAGKIVMKLLFRFKWDATPDRSRCVVKPLKAKTNQFGFRRSLFWMCLEGERPGHVWHCNCCFHNLTTSSKPVPNSVWPTRVAGFFSKFG